MNIVLPRKANRLKARYSIRHKVAKVRLTKEFSLSTDEDCSPLSPDTVLQITMLPVGEPEVHRSAAE